MGNAVYNAVNAMMFLIYFLSFFSFCQEHGKIWLLPDLLFLLHCHKQEVLIYKITSWGGVLRILLAPGKLPPFET